MELLLNLAWLLLALPAYWLWRDFRTVPAERRFTSLQCLLALGCMLVILFPVISATDDLHAMCAEMEESPSSKRSVRQASTDKPSAWKWRVQPVLAAISSSFVPRQQCSQHLRNSWFAIPAAPAVERTGRAPPASFLG